MKTDEIQRVFSERFKTWKIRIPKAKLTGEKAGFIEKAGWLIQYCFGHDEKGGYLDYYSAHHMASDDHVRIREDGSKEYLPSMASGFFYAEGVDEEERERASREANRKVTEMLIAKGFDKFTIKMAMEAGLDGDEPDSPDATPKTGS